MSAEANVQRAHRNDGFINPIERSANGARILSKLTRTVGASWRASRLAHGAAHGDPVDFSRSRAYAYQQLCREFCRIHNVTLDVEGQVPPSGSILVANHLSYIDPLVIGSLCPLIAISKVEVSRWPWVGRCAATLGMAFVDRASPMSGAIALRKLLRSLRAGVSVLNFPEGTTTTGDSVLPFKRGVFGLARLAAAPVIPVRIDMASSMCWVGDEPFLPHYTHLCASQQTRIRLRFGRPIQAKPHSAARGGTSWQLTRHVEQLITSMGDNR